ncbi:hypothetical protein SAMN02910418_01935 [Bowdeniella nasicola]|uniref:DUF1648 domain-containing protein n=1 Tax=Bowdeniella nasicola TaxID=208480 RepID=A0A1H4CDA7_9ACTO|nr:hypothetical protein [Bowdeniella nasicola]SEA58401.1 hypothetical protein SAMN02910418_01935 [Bowdeniella nasicola]
MIWLTNVLLLPAIFVTTTIAWATTQKDRAAGDYRAVIALVVGALVWAGGIAFTVVAENPNAVLPGGFVLAGVALACLTYLALPRPQLAVREAPATSSPGVLAEGMAQAGRPALILGWASVALLAAVIIMLVVIDSSMWWFALLLALFALLIPLFLQPWRILVTGRDVQLRTQIPFIQRQYPLTEIVRAEVSQVDPFGEFGGFGYRANLSGERGVVLKKGPALRLHLAGERTFVATTDDAAPLANAVNEVINSSQSGPDAPLPSH